MRAAGSGPPLTPTASHDGEVVASNLLEGNHWQPNYTGLASVVFTVPALASAGLFVPTAQAQGLQFQGLSQRHVPVGSASLRLGETTSGFKVLVEEGSQRILAHISSARMPKR